VLLSAGQYVEMIVSQDSGSALFLDSATLSLRRVSL